jgi:crossover junction endodeoxyribonuclease RusA
MELELPLELVLRGVATSQQASTKSRQRWLERLRTAVKAEKRASAFLVEGPVVVTIFVFPDAPMRGDLDNILKPILDAFTSTVYVDDGQVERIWVQKFEPGRAARMPDSTPRLAEALSMDGPRLYVKVERPLNGTAL